MGKQNIKRNPAPDDLRNLKTALVKECLTQYEKNEGLEQHSIIILRFFKNLVCNKCKS